MCQFLPRLKPWVSLAHSKMNEITIKIPKYYIGGLLLTVCIISGLVLICYLELQTKNPDCLSMKNDKFEQYWIECILEPHHDPNVTAVGCRWEVRDNKTCPLSILLTHCDATTQTSCLGVTSFTQERGVYLASHSLLGNFTTGDRDKVDIKFKNSHHTLSVLERKQKEWEQQYIENITEVI